MKYGLLLVIVFSIAVGAHGHSAFPYTPLFRSFNTSGPGGIDPCWFLGFNPMPDPASDNQPADLRDRLEQHTHEPQSRMYIVFCLLHDKNKHAGDAVSFLFSEVQPPEPVRDSHD